MHNALRFFFATTIIASLSVLTLGCSSGKDSKSQPSPKTEEQKKADRDSHPNRNQDISNEQLSCSNEAFSFAKSKNLSFCCIEANNILVTNDSLNVITIESGKKIAQVSGDSCQVVAFSGLADTDLGLSIMGSKYVLPGPQKALLGLRGGLEITGKSNENRTIIQSPFDTDVSVGFHHAGDLALKNIIVRAALNSIKIDIINGKQKLVMENVDLLDAKTGLTMKAVPMKGAPDVGNLTLQIEKNFKPDFKAVRMKNTTVAFEGDYPYDLSSIAYIDDQDQLIKSKPLYILSGSYLGRKGHLIPHFLYILKGGLSLFGNSVLTIDAGVTVKVEGGLIDVHGATLLSNGTAENPVILTSYRDDILGDTNWDEDSTSPSNQDWSGIRAGSYGTITSEIKMTNTNVKYAGIALGKSNLLLKDSSIESGSTCGDGSYIYYNQGACLLNSFYSAALNIFYGSRVTIEGTTTIKTNQDDHIRNGIIISSHVAGPNETSLEITEGSKLNFELSADSRAVCIDNVVNKHERPYNTGSYNLRFSGVEDELIEIKLHCSN